MIKFNWRIQFAVLVLLVTVAIPCGSVYAGQPIDKVKTDVEKVMALLRDSSGKGETSRAYKREGILELSDQFFDFHELSRRTMGRPWKTMTKQQRDEFIGLFRSILERAYLDRLLDYSDEKVEFRGETMLTERKATVSTVIVTKTKEVPIDYRLIRKGGDWGVYDVIVEGVSLVKNYRTQFRQILKKNTTDDLLAILKKKVDKGEK